jgi:hypothetical protein
MTHLNTRLLDLQFAGRRCAAHGCERIVRVRRALAIVIATYGFLTHSAAAALFQAAIVSATSLGPWAVET